MGESLNSFTARNKPRAGAGVPRQDIRTLTADGGAANTSLGPGLPCIDLPDGRLSLERPLRNGHAS
jgi:hypothetical protein